MDDITYETILELEEKFENAFNSAISVYHKLDTKDIYNGLANNVLHRYLTESLVLVEEYYNKEKIIKLITKFPKSDIYKELFLKNLIKHIIKENPHDITNFEKFDELIKTVYKFSTLEEARDLLYTELNKYKVVRMKSETKVYDSIFAPILSKKTKANDKYYTLKRSLVFKKGPEIDSEIVPAGPL